MAFLSVSPIVNHTEEAEAAYTPSTSTVTITSASNIASVDITPNSASGTFVSSATAGSEVTFGVTTDNLTGYTIAVAARSGDTSGQLTNASYSDTLDTIASPVNETTFANDTTGTYTNKWGLKSSKYNTSTSTWDPLASGNYIPAPKTSDVVLDTTTSPNSTPIQYRVGIGAKVDYEKAAGTYTNTYILQAVGNQISYQINYLDTFSGSPVNVFSPEGSSNVAVSKFNLNATEPTKTNYMFIGWCDGTVTHPANNSSVCTGTVYQPGDEYTFASLSTVGTNTANLYAMWGIPMQDYAFSQCKTYASSADITVYDKRDKNAYTVRYIDGSCWMTQNLRFGYNAANPSTYSISLATADTNTNTNKTMTFYDFVEYGDSGEACYGDVSGGVGTGGSYSNACARSGLDADGTPLVYYNYYAATTGTISGTSNTNASRFDICPAGWRLPLDSEATKVITHKADFKPSYSGYYYTGSLHAQTTAAYWYTSTAFNAYARYSIKYYSGNLSIPTSADNLWRRTGSPVRCVRSIDMQNVSTADLNAAIPNAGDSALLRDNRDGQMYTVAKLTDGRVWMIDNLNLGAESFSTSLDSTNTHVSASTMITATAFNNWRTTTGTYTFTAGEFLPVNVAAGTATVDYDPNSNSKYGVLYNFCAASAGTYCYPNTANYGNASYDICPAGWRLPVGGSSGEYVTLNNKYNTAAKMHSPVTSGGAGFALPGYFTSAGIKSLDTYGYYWSSTRSDNTIMYDMSISSSTVVPAHSGSDGRRCGRSIRCIKN